MAHDLNPHSKRIVRGAALATYIAGLAAWILVFHFGVGLTSLLRTPYLWIAFLLPVALLAINLGFSQQETVNTFGQERAESNIVQQTAFYSMASLFAFTGVLTRLNADMLGIIVPILALALFFAIVLVMPPVWVSTEDPREIIIIKHIKTCFLTFAHGLIASVMCYVIFYKAEKVSGHFVLQRRMGVPMEIDTSSLKQRSGSSSASGNPKLDKLKLLQTAQPSQLQIS
jgi:hypothetical protein